MVFGEEEGAEGLLATAAAAAAQSGTTGREIPPPFLLNATSVLSGPAWQQHSRYKGDHVCV